jgi:hypothetical protein
MADYAFGSIRPTPLFGEAALSLKHGRLALAIERGRVDRDAVES